ncbi:GtrA domain-containing protein [Streptomyces blattellae]|uniref:hypothetical protein n=1 Tax=Streptomyces blattellae TaxID=2569855 RepID=UPI0012B8DFF4|nr:hypothetical protein [Streptomyces blattellae]
MIGSQRTEPSRTDGDARPAPGALGPLASFARFVLCGGGVTVAASAVLPWAAELMPMAVANALITVVTTLLCTELHARITFRTGQRAGWRQHLESAGTATAAYAVTTTAMLVLDALQPSAGALWQQAVYLGASGLAGIGRFLLLRLVVFADRRKTTEARAQSPLRVTNGLGALTLTGSGIDKTPAEAGVALSTRSARWCGTSARLLRVPGRYSTSRTMSLATSAPVASAGVTCPVPG